MQGGRKHGIEIYGVKSSRKSRHTRDCSADEKEEEQEEEEDCTQASRSQVHCTISFGVPSRQNCSQEISMGYSIFVNISLNKPCNQRESSE
jgi:hypothetical protein